MTADTWAIETQNLTRIYGSDVTAVHALQDVNLRVAHGELVSVMGPSGSGKSTLLNMVGALDVPTKGKVFVAGQDLATIRDMDTFRAKTVGFVFQLHNLIPTMTARENIEIPMIGHIRKLKRRQRAEELLELVGLRDRAGHLPSQMSGGERQRVAVARALANNPSLILADEPTGNLDTKAGENLMALVRKLNRSQGTTFLVVTHDPAVARQTDRVIVMADGRAVREDTVNSPLEEDLKMWRNSELGQRILMGNDHQLEALASSQEQIEAVRTLLNAAKERD